MLRVIRDLIIVALIVFAVFLFAKHEKFNSRYWPETIQIREINLEQKDSLIFQSDTALIPVSYIGSIDFRNVDDDRRKDLFIQRLLPAIVITRHRLLDDLHHIEFIEKKMVEKRKLAKEDSIFLFEMRNKYMTDSLQELKIRIYPHPVSMALTQAILETGWGTSNIFRRGNNIFGIMSFSSDDSRSMVQFHEGDDVRYLRTYNSLIESVEHYYLLTSRVSSYAKFREKRWIGTGTRDLFHYISSYHESDHYIKMAQSIIQSNDLERYDHVAIDQRYLEKPTFKAFLMKR